MKEMFTNITFTEQGQLRNCYGVICSAKRRGLGTMMTKQITVSMSTQTCINLDKWLEHPAAMNPRRTASPCPFVCVSERMSNSAILWWNLALAMITKLHWCDISLVQIGHCCLLSHELIGGKSLYFYSGCSGVEP